MRSKTIYDGATDDHFYNEYTMFLDHYTRTAILVHHSYQSTLNQFIDST